MHKEFKFPSLSACGMSDDDIRYFSVGRDDEYREVLNDLIRKNHNVLIYGERGIGKTFLIRSLYEKIVEAEKDILPIFINLAGLRSYSPADNAASFPRAILLQICSVIWSNYLGNSYLDLRDSISDSGQEITLKSKPEKTVQRLYRHLMSFERKAQNEFVNSVGFSALAKGEKSEKTTASLTQSDILPFEFVEFVNELKENVLPYINKQRIILICDEANMLPQYEQKELLERYVEIFTEKRVQFIFVAGYLPWQDIPSIPSCFETSVGLKGLCSEEVTELLYKCITSSDYSFENSGALKIFEIFNGHPRLSINAFERASIECLNQNAKLISKNLVIRACQELEQRLEREKAQYHA